MSRSIVYRLEFDPDGYQTLMQDFPYDYEKSTFNGERREAWDPWPVVVWNRRAKRPNFFSIGNVSGAFAIDEHAAEELSYFVHPHLVQLLPLVCPDVEGLQLVNVVSHVNCLDAEASLDEFGGFMRYVFKEHLLADDGLFKIPESDDSEVLVAQFEDSGHDFVAAVAAGGLSGARFVELWRSS